jgi:site-specific DNA recombinase
MLIKKGLLTLPQLRQRMPGLRKQAQAVESEVQSLEMAAADQAKYLQLAECLAGFRSKLRLRAETLDIRERQQVLRLLVKEVLVGANSITIRHSIPVPQTGPQPNGAPRPPLSPSGGLPPPGYLLRTGSKEAALGEIEIWQVQNPRAVCFAFLQALTVGLLARLSDRRERV